MPDHTGKKQDLQMVNRRRKHMKTTNDEKNMNYDYEHMDTDALKKRILAYRKMSEAMTRAAEAIKQKGAKA